MDARFATYRAIAETVALDHANDVLALSQEGRLHLVRAHSAHVRNDWAGYLRAVDAINGRLVAIADTARRWAADVQASTEIHPDQIAIWTRPDQAVVAAAGGVAA